MRATTIGRLATTFAIMALASGCAQTQVKPQAKAAAGPAPIKEIAPGYLAGYLPAGGAPSSLEIIPPPPVAGSAAQARDDERSKQGLALNGGPRWTLATRDATLKFPDAAETFACTLGVEISQTATPRTYVMLRRTLVDLGLSTYPTKNKYARTRPFVVNGQPQCTPAEDAVLRKDGSYPSGHSAIGYGWGLILAEAAPDRAADLVARGRSFGESRRVCNVHWQSDIDEGRVMASAMVARLHADPTFQADLEAVKAEIAAARAGGAKPTRDCTAEAAALAMN